MSINHEDLMQQQYSLNTFSLFLGFIALFHLYRNHSLFEMMRQI